MEELLGCGEGEEALVAGGVGVQGGFEAFASGAGGHEPENAGKHAVLGLGAPTGPVVLVGVALAQENGEGLGGEVDFEVPVVVVVGGGEDGHEVWFEDAGGS